MRNIKKRIPISEIRKISHKGVSLKVGFPAFKGDYFKIKKDFKNILNFSDSFRPAVSF